MCTYIVIAFAILQINVKEYLVVYVKIISNVGFLKKLFAKIITQ